MTYKQKSPTASEGDSCNTVSRCGRKMAPTPQSFVFEEEIREAKAKIQKKPSCDRIPVKILNLTTISSYDIQRCVSNE